MVVFLLNGVVHVVRHEGSTFEKDTTVLSESETDYPDDLPPLIPPDDLSDYQTPVPSQTGARPCSSPSDWTGMNHDYSSQHAPFFNSGHPSADNVFLSFALSRPQQTVSPALRHPQNPAKRHKVDRSSWHCQEPGCNRTFSQSWNLKRHGAVAHRGEKPYICRESYCGEAFSYSSRLKKHEELVHGRIEKRFTCPEPGCVKIFSYLSQLQKHEAAVHRAEKPFPCQETGCVKSFSQAVHLKTHVSAVHRREKPFICSEPGCGQGFSQSGNLNRHVVSIHRVDKSHLPKSDCPEGFSQSGNLKVPETALHCGWS
eukprot:gb/GEZN01008125.1/.p1 GENE.gb/GEZN01008125.1/~~gb/GEZN01008125.1/.p1  ORF type:complete len:313 (+),score=22.11 gb/GEZN01008125.1/:151-1089(+)